MVLSLLNNNGKCSTFFEYFGMLVFGYACLKTGLRLWNNFATFFLGFGVINFKKHGSWAVVTGCTDGIGKAYAEHLAKKGLNIVLISRTLEKLQEQAKYLNEKYKIETKVIAVDFTESSSIYTTINSQISDLDIGVLVNNVGMGYKHPEFLDTLCQNDKFVNDMINCNIMSVTKMSAIVLPGMAKRKRGVIINISSGSGRVPTPLLTVYSATKAYVDFFSRALAVEYKSKGIIIQSLCPYFVSTKLSAVRSAFMIPKPDGYVRDALATIGTQSISNGCLSHNIQGWFYENVLPTSVYNSVGFKQMLAVRNRAINRAKKQAEATQKND